MNLNKLHNTQATKKAFLVVLDYVATYPNNGTKYRKIGMKLAAHSKSGYLNITNSHSSSGAHIFLSEEFSILQFNGEILAVSKIIKSVMS